MKTTEFALMEKMWMFPFFNQAIPVDTLPSVTYISSMGINLISKVFIIISVVFVPRLFCGASEAVKKIVFQERTIEGKIRRPQLVLIKADQRPKFASMLLSGVDEGINPAVYTDSRVLSPLPNEGAFEFSSKNITNYEE